jgi:hypothetical protein
MNIVKEIRDLPYDIIRVIQEFIPHKKLVFVNSIYYNLHHNLLKNSIPMYENYIRDMIRRDNDFVFEKIIGENMDRWLKNKQYRYKNMVFNNYIYFVIHYCIENNSENCRKLLMDYLIKHDLCRNLHKKKVIKYIKWTN